MALMQSQFVVPFADLRYLSIECGKCKTVITVDLDGADCNPSQCPVCLQAFDQASVRGHIQSLATMYKQIKQIPHRFTFKIPVKSG
jgi:hypothetical protein